MKIQRNGVGYYVFFNFGRNKQTNKKTNKQTHKQKNGITFTEIVDKYM